LEAELAEHLRELAHTLRLVHPDELMAHLGGVRERPEQVEEGADAERLPRRGGVPERAVETGSEEKNDACALEAAPRGLGVEVERDAEGLEDVGAAGGGRDRAVAVLGHAD